MRVPAASNAALASLCACAALAAAPARAQTMLDQEQRLIELHSLLVSLPPANPPGALGAGELSLGVELITIPTIDGQTGGKRQLTASDRTPAFPRLRAALALPAPDGFRASVGLGFIPPLEIAQVQSLFGGVEGEFAWVPGPLALGVQAHFLAAHSTSPVTDPNFRDTLDDWEAGASLGAGYAFELGFASVTPFASAGLARVSGDFKVTSDGYVLSSRTWDALLTGGVRVLLKQRIEAAAELVAIPGRMVHPSFRVAWVPLIWK